MQSTLFADEHHASILSCTLALLDSSTNFCPEITFKVLPTGTGAFLTTVAIYNFLTVGLDPALEHCMYVDELLDIAALNVVLLQIDLDTYFLLIPYF